MRASWLIPSPTSHKELDATGLRYLGLVAGTLGLQVGARAVQQVHVLRVDVDVLEEVVPHVRVVALWVVPWQACVDGWGSVNGAGGGDETGAVFMETNTEAWRLNWVKTEYDPNYKTCPHHCIIDCHY